MSMKKIAILGSTGSIGTQTLEVVRENGDIEVLALAAGSNITLLEAQIREFGPKLAAVWSEEKARELKSRVRDLDVRVVSGMDGLLETAAMPEAEILVTAIVGMIGIRPTIEAIKAGKDIALANRKPWSLQGISSCLWQRSGGCPSFRWTASTARSSNHSREDSKKRCIRSF